MGRRRHKLAARSAAQSTDVKAPVGQGALNISNRYDAASYGRRMRGWVAPNSGPNTAIDGMETIRNRVRDTVRNEWSGASGARIWVTNLIGTGIVPRPRTKDAALKARINDAWAAWVPQADADGVLDFYGLQALATRAWVSAGEVFLRIRWRRPEDGLSAPVQIQLLESDMVPLLDTNAWPGMQPGNTIRSGIEINRIGQRVAYWMYRAHPGDKALGIVPSMADLTRVPAAEVRHLYEPLRPGQMRGVSDLAAIVAKLRGVMDFDDAVLERQKIANLFALFITRPIDENGNDPITGKPPVYDASGNPIAALRPGISQELLPGENVTFSEPPDAGTGYSDFMRQQHLGVASGQGMPYELLTGDIKDISDRTLRVIINEFRRHCEQRQWQLIIPKFCQPIREAWANAATVAGTFTAAEEAEACNVEWQPQGWAYIHPVQDAQGKRIEVDAGFRSRSSVISERGDDPDAVDAERAADEDREAELGLAEEIPGPTQTAVAETRNELRDIRASMAGMLAAGDRPSVVNVAAPIVNLGDTHVAAPIVNNQLQPTPVENHIHMPEQPAANVEVNVEAVMPEQPAPQVNITNEVQPAQISEVSIVSMVARETTTEVERDQNGNLKASTQVERDADAGA